MLDLSVVIIILQLIYLEGILSIDNAAVLGAMVSHLPADQPIPWPRPLRGLQKPVHRLLGGQRLAALKVGLLGAYLGRGSMLLVASWVVEHRWVLILGGLYLIRLAADYLGDRPGGAVAAEATSTGQPTLAKVGRSFWSVVLAVEFADLAFSLDNVVAAVALSRELWVVITGVFLGIVTLRFAAGIFVYLIKRFPELEAAAYLLVLNIGLLLLAEELLHYDPTDLQKFAFSVGTIVLTLLWGRIPAVQRVGVYFRWLRRVLGVINLAFIYLLRPLSWFFGAGALVVRWLVFALTTRGRAREADLEEDLDEHSSSGDHPHRSRRRRRRSGTPKQR